MERPSFNRVLDEAEKFFGPEGLKMTRGARQAGQVSFFGDGQAWITVWPPNDEKSGSRVDLDSSRRDADIRRFRRHLHEVEHSPAPAAPGG